MKLYRKNDGGNNLIVFGVLGVAGYLAYSWYKNLASTATTVPLTSNTTIATQSNLTNTNLKYQISSADLQAIYNIASTQTSGFTNGTGTWGNWQQAYLLYKGFNPPDVAQDVHVAGDKYTVLLTGSEFANWVNNWVNNQGLSGLGIIGLNYGPSQNNTYAGYFGIMNALSR